MMQQWRPALAPFAVVAILFSQIDMALSQCMSLQGSAMCPRYQSLSINPTNLSSSWSFFNQVTDVASFDAAFALYLAPNGQFARTKQVDQLGCTNGGTGGLVLQYQRTFLCGEFTSISYSAACNNRNADLMTCQSTCLTFAASESSLVANSTVCPTNYAPTTRNATMVKDFTQCTDWVTLSTTNTSTCITGASNEGSCGFGVSTTQLCSFCDPSKGLVDECCIGGSTDLSTCGFTVNAAQVNFTGSSSTMMPTSTSSIASSPSTSSSSSAAASLAAAASSSKRLSGGAIAGAVVGSVVGAALLALLALFLCMRLRRKRRRAVTGTTTLDSEGAGGSSAFVGSEKAAGTPYSGHTMAGTPNTEKAAIRWNSSDSGAGLGLGAGAAAAAGAAGAGAAAAAAGAGDTKLAKDQDRPLSSSTTHTGITNQSTDDGRVTLPAFQDMYSATQITPGSHVEAIYSYTPSLPDELQLTPGDVVRVDKIYDDNWARGLVQDVDGLNRVGTFPLVCVTAGSRSEDLSGGASRSGRSNEGYHTAGSVDVSDRGSSMGDATTALPPPIPTSNIPSHYFPSRARRVL